MVQPYVVRMRRMRSSHPPRLELPPSHLWICSVLFYRLVQDTEDPSAPQPSERVEDCDEKVKRHLMHLYK